MHQGFPESATAPAAQVISWLITTDAVDAAVRGELVDFLGAVAHATCALQGDSHFASLIPGLEVSIIEGYRAVARLLDRDAPDLRRLAGETAVEQLRLPQLASERPPMVARLRDWITQPDETRHVWVRLLGDLGEDVGEFLDDPDHAVRIRAALAPSSLHNIQATDSIVAALGDALPPGVHRAELVQATIARIDDFDLIAEPAAVIAQQAHWAGFDFDWGPLLNFAFRPPYRPGAPLSPAQRLFLQALVRNEQLWDPRNGSIRLVFTQAGLPHTTARSANRSPLRSRQEGDTRARPNPATKAQPPPSHRRRPHPRHAEAVLAGNLSNYDA